MHPILALLIRYGRYVPRIVAGVATSIWLFQEELIFNPKPTPRERLMKFSHQATTIPVENDITLHGWRHPGNPGAAETDCDILIFFGGRKCEMSSYISKDSQYFSCQQWYINYRGYGQSGGEPSANDLRTDALQIYNTAVAQWENNHHTKPRIAVMGYSLGTHMAAYVAASCPTHKLILVTPYDMLASAINGYVPFFKFLPHQNEALLRHPFNTVAEAPRVHAPTLFLLAKDDEVVPNECSQKLIDAWHAPCVVKYLHNTTHEDIIETEDYRKEVAKFMGTNSSTSKNIA